VWLTDNNAAFISKTPNSIEDLAVQKYVRDFAVQEYKLAVEEELKMERNKLNDIEKQQASLIKDEEKSNKKINDNLRAIAKAKDKIVTTQSDIDAASVKIENQKKMVDKTAADANATKGAKKTLNDLEKDKVKSQKNTDGDAKDIESWEKEIREEQRNIADGKQKQGLKLSDIDAQKQIVYGVQTKLSNIK
jgi:chromosome segregation ATPase